MKRLKAGRVALNTKSTEDLNYMIDELKQGGPYMKGGPSDLVSFIVSEFRKKFFEKEKEMLSERFFDRRSYVGDRIKGAKSQEEYDKVLDDEIEKRLKERKKSRSKAKSQPQNAQGIEVGS